MNITEIMKNWKEFTGTESVKYFFENEDSDGTGYETDSMVCDFCEKYNYGNDIYRFLDKSYN